MATILKQSEITDSGKYKPIDVRAGRNEEQFQDQYRNYFLTSI